MKGGEILHFKLKRTCWACPSQWEGKTENDEWVYIRYRWGTFRVYVGKVEKFLDVIDDKYLIIEEKRGGQYDGFMTNSELAKILEKHGITIEVVDDEDDPEEYLDNFFDSYGLHSSNNSSS